MQQHRLCSLPAVLLITAVTLGAVEAAVPDPARVKQITEMLPSSPRGVGRTIDDRKAWEPIAASDALKGFLSGAERLMSEPIPELTDELYLDFSRTGNRTRCQAVLSRRHSRMPLLVLAECIENRGRFLGAIEEAIRAICSEKTWVMPAHDRSLRNFKGTVIEIDLAVAGLSWNLATADYWLGDKLGPKTRKLIRDELKRRTFDPFVGTVRTGEPRMWWMRSTNNWNAVCLAGTTGSALAIIDPQEQRAFFIAAAEKYVQNFLRGFTPDGYCSEGVGYWNYGFGHYVMLAETVKQATGGKVDMLEGAKIKQIALFGRRMEIVPGVYPAFADCGVRTRPQTQLMAFLSRRYRLGLKEVEQLGPPAAAGPSTRLFELGLFAFPNSASAMPAPEGPTPSQPPSDWFAEAGILICRPAPGNKHALGVAMKGGHNGEHHNHNDVGSYVVALGKATPLVDPGSEVYTARTFSARRYESGVLNSFGHPVPRVAGKLQRTGRSAAAKVLKTEFTDKADTLVLDIRSAYDVNGLKKLQRTFVFSRKDAGRLTVIDEVEFDSPKAFGTALITFSKWKQIKSNRLLIGEGPEAVQVNIAIDGGEFQIDPTKIKEHLHGGRIPTRLGIELAKPVTKATITLKIAPASEG